MDLKLWETRVDIGGMDLLLIVFFHVLILLFFSNKVWWDLLLLLYLDYLVVICSLLYDDCLVFWLFWAGKFRSLQVSTFCKWLSFIIPWIYRLYWWTAQSEIWHFLIWLNWLFFFFLSWFLDILRLNSALYTIIFNSCEHNFFIFDLLYLCLLCS